jgi:hypothetical protein
MKESEFIILNFKFEISNFCAKVKVKYQLQQWQHKKIVKKNDKDNVLLHIIE